MEIKDWEALIVGSEVGAHSLIILENQTEITRAYSQVRRASHFGYKLCFSRLHGNKFYFEKIEDGRVEQYMNRRR